MKEGRGQSLARGHPPRQTNPRRGANHSHGSSIDGEGLIFLAVFLAALAALVANDFHFALLPQNAKKPRQDFSRWASGPPLHE